MIKTVCGHCGKEIFKWNYQMNKPIHFCNNTCKGKWMSANCVGENGYNWNGGTWNNRKPYLAHTSYRTWRKNILKDAQCLVCGSVDNLELHHIDSKMHSPDKIKDESNVCPICSTCHDTLHSNSSKGGELRETLSAILAYDNPQPSLSNAMIYVGRKVHRLMGEDATNKPNTSATPERDEIVGTIEKSIEAVV
jgi:5-methylcytosine-specific restriction endonuclease McrA